MSELNLQLPTTDFIKIRSESALKFDELTRLFLSAYTPGLKFFDNTETVPAFTITFVESDKKSVEVFDKEIVLHDSLSNNIPFDLYHLFYSISRKLFIEKNTYPIHSSCFDNNGLVLVVGHSGSGKTTVAMNMIMNHGSKWASGNKTLLSFTPDEKIRVWAGTETTTVKQSDESMYANIIGEKVPYFDRLAFQLKQDYMYKFTPESVLKSIVLIGHLEGYSEFKELSSLSALHALFPFFLDVVNADTVLCDGGAVYSYEAGTPAKELLARNLEKSLRNTKIYSIKGSKNFVFDTLTKV